MKRVFLRFGGALTVSLTASALSAMTVTETELLAADGAAFDHFGYSVRVSGPTAIIGAAYDDDNGSASGSAYLFDIRTGTQIAKLIADDGGAGNLFGSSVGISGTTAIVGAHDDDDNGIVSGSAYLFDTRTGAQITKLTANDGARGDSFGYSAAISGTTAIVGARGGGDNGNLSGSAYLFDTVTGAQIAKLTASDGARLDNFGYSVAISGTTAIVGASSDDDNGNNSGSAYLFDTVTGAEIGKLTASDGEAYDYFGGSVGISGTTAIVGARGGDKNGVRSSGSAYLFDVLTGAQIGKLTADDAAISDNFGWSVGISGAIAIVGAYTDGDNGNHSGSAYLFDTSTGTQIKKLTASNGEAYDYFGFSVGISGTTAIVGAIDEHYDDYGAHIGSAYIYSMRTATVPVPAGIWLLGSALALAGTLRRWGWRRRYFRWSD